MERATPIQTDRVDHSGFASLEVKNKAALRRIETFRRRFNEPHLYLAYHAAFPIALTPDLLYSLWANFRRDIHGDFLEIPWIAVADLLLSNLCNEVGYELYEMDRDVRRELIRQLKEDKKRFGQQRIRELSQFLLDYVKKQLRSDDSYIQDSAKVQHLTALAYTQPTAALSELALMLVGSISGLTSKESLEQIYNASLVEEFEESLGNLEDFKQLQQYAHALEKYARGNLGQAVEQFRTLLGTKKQITVAGVVLSVPLQLQLFDKNRPPGWHTLSLEQVLDMLGSDLDAGLTSQEVANRLQLYGFNELLETGGRSPWKILSDQFTNVMLILLVAIAIVYGILDLLNFKEMLAAGDLPFKYTITILAIVILNGLLGYFQESRAEQSLAALKRLLSPRVRVIRDRRLREVDSKELVPGDVMLLEAGGEIAADGRLLDTANLQVREAALTGEAQAVTKEANLELPDDTPIGDRLNLIYQGTEVVDGRGTVVVTATGMRTELGRIANILQSVETEPSPLQMRIDQLARVLVVGSLILVALVVLGGVLILGFAQLPELLKVSLSMAVSLIPIGLPPVLTVSLALGTQRMVRRNALIRRLPALETLGSVTTICFENTGILTLNRMVVQWIFTSSQALQVTGEGYDPNGEFYRIEDGEQTPLIAPGEAPELSILLTACTVCNDALLQQEGGEWVILGDPTEGALLTLAAKARFEKDQWDSHLPRVMEFPLSSERKRMSVIVEVGDPDLRLSGLATPYWMFMKGLPNTVLERCTQIQIQDIIQPLSKEQRERILEQNNQAARQGLKILGFAGKPLMAIPSQNEDARSEQDLIWLGIVGMQDTIRPEVRDAIARCRTARVLPIMITGDDPLTAQAVAEDLGIAHSNAVLTGRDLNQMSQSDMEERVDDVSVYADVASEHKLRIVQALQRRGHIVAMTGVGVNDAPALKQADIGVAMGIMGTDVCKEASDMILLDDNFATIVAAIEEGRVVYSNIRRVVKYMLSSQMGAVMVVAAGPLIGVGGVPLSPLQFLWLYLVVLGLPSLGLVVEPAEPNVMRHPPYAPTESIFARGLGLYMTRIGIIIATLGITFITYSYSSFPESWKTMTFTAIVFAEMGHALAVRSNIRLLIELNPFSNPYLLIAVALTTLLQLSLIYIPFLRDFFTTNYLTPVQLAICFGFGSLLFIWIELEKLFFRLYFSHRG